MEHPLVDLFAKLSPDMIESMFLDAANFFYEAKNVAREAAKAAADNAATKGSELHNELTLIWWKYRALFTAMADFYR